MAAFAQLNTERVFMPNPGIMRIAVGIARDKNIAR